MANQPSQIIDNINKDKLNEKKDVYIDNIDDWSLYELVWRSGSKLIDYSLYRHPLESVSNHEARIRDGYVFNFGKSIIDIFNFYINEKDVIRKLEAIEKDPRWEMFLNDADLNGTNYNVFLDEAQKLASVYGSIGILINKPGIPGETMTVQKELDAGIYPYYSMYSLPNIYDWKYERDELTHRRILVYLKLKESDGTWLLWTPQLWEHWGLDEKTKQPVLLGRNENTLKEIPFVWMLNLKDIVRPEIGSSDLIDISRIVTSIAQNLSCGEEMIKMAGFPIRRQPMESSDSPANEEEKGTGPRAIEEFNPEYGDDGKPDWMPTEILEPVEATLKWIDRKTDEIYRIAHLSGVHGQRKSNNEVASGLAIRYEFSQLNSVLIAKSINQTEAELNCLKFWLKWQNKEADFDKMDIYRSTQFSIDEMAVALDNAITAMQKIASKHFRVLVQEKIADHTLPDMTQKDKEIISEEIEENTPDKVVTSDEPTGSRHIVRPADQAAADHSDVG